jgi:hypothetical protein
MLPDRLFARRILQTFEAEACKYFRFIRTFRNIEFSNSIHRPGIKKQTKGNTTFRKLDLFPSSGVVKKRILLGPLERASPNHWTIVIHHRQNTIVTTHYDVLNVF